MSNYRKAVAERHSSDPCRSPRCSLCSSPSTLFHEDAARRYFRCHCCQLVFVDPHKLLSAEEEKRYYDTHQNDPSDLRYRRFLNRLFDPLNSRLLARSRGLDFGSGPGPTLSLMFTESGHEMRIYDPFYAPDETVLRGAYDFITASEVVEHLHHPGQTFARLWSLLRIGGWLGIMTKRVLSVEAFRRWHYKSDPTHVSFFSLETFAWLGDALDAEWIVAGDDVVLIRRSSARDVDWISDGPGGNQNGLSACDTV